MTHRRRWEAWGMNPMLRLVLYVWLALAWVDLILAAFAVPDPSMVLVVGAPRANGVPRLRRSTARSGPEVYRPIPVRATKARASSSGIPHTAVTMTTTAMP